MAYGDKVAVDGLSREGARGSITAVLGPNGAGKTTTLETCEGYRVAQRGTVRVLGLDPQRDRAELLPRIGVMLQSGGAWSGVRAVEMLEHMASLHAHPLDTAMLVDRLGLADCGRTPYRRLSGGQKQRLGLAIALVGRPELAFADGAPESLRRELGPLTEVRQLDEVSMLIHGPADASTLGRVSRWCEEHAVLPQTLTLGQRTLEDVFLELTGRELAS